MTTGSEHGQIESTPEMVAHFSWMRTRMSAERTLEAWVRTAVSLIGFGFTIVQFFERLDQMATATPSPRPSLARYMGLILIAVGTVALAISIWQYQVLTRHLKDPPFPAIASIKGVPQIPTLLIVAVTLCLAGALAFFAILFQVK